MLFIQSLDTLKWADKDSIQNAYQDANPLPHPPKNYFKTDEEAIFNLIINTFNQLQIPLELRLHTHIDTCTYWILSKNLFDLAVCTELSRRLFIVWSEQ